MKIKEGKLKAKLSIPVATRSRRRKLSIQVDASSMPVSNIQGGSCLKHSLILVIVVDFCIMPYNWIFHVRP